MSYRISWGRVDYAKVSGGPAGWLRLVHGVSNFFLLDASLPY